MIHKVYSNHDDWTLQTRSHHPEECFLCQKRGYQTKHAPTDQAWPRRASRALGKLTYLTKAQIKCLVSIMRVQLMQLPSSSVLFAVTVFRCSTLPSQWVRLPLLSLELPPSAPALLCSCATSLTKRFMNYESPHLPAHYRLLLHCSLTNCNMSYYEVCLCCRFLSSGSL